MLALELKLLLRYIAALSSLFGKIHRFELEIWHPRDLGRSDEFFIGPRSAWADTFALKAEPCLMFDGRVLIYLGGLSK